MMLLWSLLGVVLGAITTFSGIVVWRIRWRRRSNAYFNVRFFGAVGDGATDDTKAIQAAIKACSDAGGGGIWFPSGTYRVRHK